MKKLARAAITATAVALAGHAAHAQIAQGDFILGFTSPTQTPTPEDYVIDLGPINAFSTTATTDLSSLFSQSTYNLTFGSSAVNVGAIVGVHSGQPGDYVAVTVLRGTAGNPAAGSQGSESTPSRPTGNSVTAAATDAGSVNAGVQLSSDANSFSTQINSSPTDTGGVANQLGVNPVSAFNGTSIQEDLFESTRTVSMGTRPNVISATVFNYEGQIDINLGGSGSPTVEFIPATQVPEPSTVQLMVGAGIISLLFRRLFSGLRGASPTA
jgi:hypothetical protein